MLNLARRDVKRPLAELTGRSHRCSVLLLLRGAPAAADSGQSRYLLEFRVCDAGNQGGLMSAGWGMLAMAILLEVSGTICLKLSRGLTESGYTLAMYALYAGSFACVARAVNQIELGIAYAVWAGVGTALIAIAGVLLFNESLTLLKGVSLLLVIVGVLGLKRSTSAPPSSVDGAQQLAEIRRLTHD